MIEAFADAATEDVFYGRDTKVARRALAKELWNVIRRRLQMLHAAQTLRDLSAVPGNRFLQHPRE